MTTEKSKEFEYYFKSSIGFWVNQTAIAMRDYFDGVLKEIGFKITEAMVILILSVHKTVPLVELARRLKFSHPSVLRHIDSLEKAGIVQRIPHPEDRRIKLLSLTDNGKKVVPEIEEAFKKVHSYCRSVFEGGEDLQLIELLKKLHLKLVPEGEWVESHIKMKSEKKSTDE